MNASVLHGLDDDGGYERPTVRAREPLGERMALSATRASTSRERASRQSRFSRRPAPQRASGAHRRGNKRYGI